MDIILFLNSVMKGKRPDHGRGTGLAKSPKSKGVRIKGRLWLEKDGENLLSWGRWCFWSVFEKPAPLRRQPALWKWHTAMHGPLVAKMNRLAGEELVSRTLGGRHGGRASLTPAGEDAVARFWKLATGFGNGFKIKNTDEV